MVRTPEEVKKGLEFASTDCENARDCSKTCAYSKMCGGFYHPMTEVPCAMIDDALDLIRQLEAGLAQWEDVAASPGAVEDMARENYRLTQELETINRERDALYRDLSTRADACDVCEHGYFCKNDCKELFGDDRCSFEWRGICPENTEVSDA